jgi:hypothetical protein
MSGTVQPPPSSTNVATTQGTAATAGGLTGAALVVMVWGLSLYHITVPAEVIAAMGVLIAPLVHYIMVRLKVAGA